MLTERTYSVTLDACSGTQLFVPLMNRLEAMPPPDGPREDHGGEPVQEEALDNRFKVVKTRQKADSRPTGGIILE